VFDRLSRPSIQAATILVAIAAAAMIGWRASDADWLDAWMPNVVTGLVVLAATITVFEWVLRRDELRRLEPRLERLRRKFRGYIETYGEIVAMDYKLRGGTGAGQKDILALLDQWLEDIDNLDTDPRSLYVRPTIAIGKQMEVELRSHRTQDLDILDPALIRAIDEFLEKSAAGDALIFFTHSGDERTDRYSMRKAEASYVEAVRRFGEGVLAWDKDGGRIELSDGFLTATSVTPTSSASAAKSTV
jgi:hypothetical protein